MSYVKEKMIFESYSHTLGWWPTCLTMGMRLKINFAYK